MSKVNKPHSFRHEISVIIPIETIENIEQINSLLEFSILNQTHGMNKIVIIFMTYSENTAFLTTLSELKNKHGFKDVVIYKTDDKMISKLDSCVKDCVKTEWYCYKTITPSTINNIFLPANVQYLPNHFEEAIKTLTTDKKLNPKYIIPKIEYVDITTYGIKHDPDLLETRIFETLNIQYITLDEWILNKSVKYSWNECVSNQNGVITFVPGLLLQKFFTEPRVIGSLMENCTVRQFIHPQQIKKNLRIYVDGNVWGARA